MFFCIIMAFYVTSFVNVHYVCASRGVVIVNRSMLCPSLFGSVKVRIRLLNSPAVSLSVVLILLIQNLIYKN